MKRILSRLPLALKLLLVGVIPITFIIILSFQNLQKDREKIDITESYISTMENAAHISHVINEMRHERRLSFRRVMNDFSSDTLNRQRLRTDAAILKLDSTADHFYKFHRYTFLGDLQNVRAAIDSGFASVTFVMDYYTNALYRFNNLNQLPAQSELFLRAAYQDLVSQKLLSEMVTHLGIISANVYNALYTNAYKLEILMGTRGVYQFYRSIETELLLKARDATRSDYDSLQSSNLHRALNEQLDTLFQRFEFPSELGAQEWANLSYRAIDDLRAMQQKLLEQSLASLHDTYVRQKYSSRVMLITTAVLLLLLIVLVVSVLRNVAQVQAELAELNKGLERKVSLRTEQLESTNRQLESFSYSVSHDLRAPLRAIVGYSRILEEDYVSKLDDEAKRLLNVVQNNTLRMGRLIDDLLNFSKMGRQEIVKFGFSTEELVKSVITELENADKVTWEIESLPESFGDPNALRQVWANLLSNAVKFSGKVDKPVIRIGASSEEEQTIFYVKDNGVGFDAKYEDKLFKVFQRLHHQKDFEGTGIGLAIVEKIVSKHNGKVWAESTPGQGASFYFSIPKPQNQSI